MHRERNRRRTIIIGLLGILFLMAVGYSAFQSKLDIKGSTKVTSNWEVLITNVTPGTPTGNAENSKDENGNVILPTWDGLSASMSADLYEAGDSMEYIVTVTNRGNIDAVLDNIDGINAQSSHSEAVIITYSGYAKGQKLHRNSSMDIKVKVEYNPEYTGGEVTGTSEISFSYEQADIKEDDDDKPVIENDIIISKDDKTITYDCTENGGTGGHTSLFDIGSNVDLSVKCTKKGYTFLGWNTDKNATSVISENSSDHTTLNNKETDTTLYGIYKKDIKVTYDNTAYEINNTKTYNAGESDDTGIILDFDNDFTIEETINVSTGGQRYLIIGNYDNSNNSQLNIEINTSNQLRVWIQKSTSMSKTNGLINMNEDINIKFIWDASEQKYYVTAKGENTDISFDGKPGFDMSSKSKNTLKIGAADYRSETSPFNEITVKSLKYGNNQEDTCTLYNKTTSCDFVVPNAVLNNDLDNTYYEFDGWYIDNTKIENPGSNHTYTESAIVEAKTIALPVMRDYRIFIDYSLTNWWNVETPDFHNDSIRETITEIEFVDTDEITPPTINNTTSWDVSEKQNGSVIAWLDGTKVYIGGKGGIIGYSDLRYLFSKFRNLTSIKFNNNFNTSMVRYFSYMFYGDINLKSIDVSNFNFNSCISLMAMFEGASFVKLDLSSWNTSNITQMDYMFSHCTSLIEVNLSSFDTSNVREMQRMFNECTNLKTIYVSNKFVTTSVTDSTNMFYNDTNLIGGNGTVYDHNNIDKTYARIDGGVSNPGYFTDAIYPVIRSVNNISTSNSIKVIADTYVPNGDEISKIEFSIDNGTTWHEQTDSSIADNIYTFTNLNANSNYTISIRVTSENNKVKTEEYEFKTKPLDIPTYTEEVYGTVEITYPTIEVDTNNTLSCSNGLTCDYSLDDGSTWESVNETTKEITYSTNGNLIARVSDGNNTVRSSYAMLIPSFSKKIISDNGGVTTIKGKGTPVFTQVATTDEGMYAAKDYDGNDTFYFRGAVENNYVHFANLYWRIIRVNGDGTVRMIYDGTSKHQNGEASNDRRVDLSAFNSNAYDNAYVGYMYGDTTSNVVTEAVGLRTITNLNVYSNYYFSDSYTYDPDANLFTLTGNIVQDTVGGYKDNGRSDLYTCFKTIQPTETDGKCTEIYKVKEYVSLSSMKAEYQYTYQMNGLSSSGRYWFGTSYNYNGDGTFSVSGDMEQLTLNEYKTANKNNLYTCFDTRTTNNQPIGKCQRLLKVRKINSATAAQVKAVEYSSTSYSSAHKNDVSSVIKTYLETWYANNLNSYSSKLSNSSVFCNNRQVSKYLVDPYLDLGYGSYITLYGYTRFASYGGLSVSPSLSCPRNDDRFTMNNSGNGNEKLSAPIGLITADEAALAGEKLEVNNVQDYLYTGHTYWTMTPAVFNVTQASSFEFVVRSSGDLNYVDVTNERLYGVRPVINIDPSKVTYSGSGTYDTPYEVS